MDMLEITKKNFSTHAKPGVASLVHSLNMEKNTVGAFTKVATC